MELRQKIGAVDLLQTTTPSLDSPSSSTGEHLRTRILHEVQKIDAFLSALIRFYLAAGAATRSSTGDHEGDLLLVRPVIIPHDEQLSGRVVHINCGHNGNISAFDFRHLHLHLGDLELHL